MQSFSDFLQQNRTATNPLATNPFTSSPMQQSQPTIQPTQYTKKEPFAYRQGVVQKIFSAPLNLGKTLARFTPEAKALKRTEQRAQALARYVRESGLDERRQNMLVNYLDNLPTLNTTLAPRNVKEITGDIIGTAMFLAPSSLGIKGATLTATAARGGIFGAGFSGAEALSDNQSFGDVIKSMALGAVIGGPLEVGGVLAVKGGQKIFQKVFEKAVDANPRFFMSIRTRLEKDFGDAGAEIADRFVTADRNAILRAGQEMDALNQAGLFQLDDLQSLQLMDALEGRIKPKQLPKALQTTFDAIDDLRVRIGKEAQSAGVMVRLQKGVEVPFKPRENYFPHMAPTTERLSNERVRQTVINNAVRVGKFATPEEAAKVLDSYLDFAATGGAKGEYWTKWLVKDGQAKTEAQAKGMTILYFKKSRIGKVGPLEKAREINFPFYNPDVREVIPAYVMGAVRRLEEIPQFGHNFEKIETLVGQVRAKKGDFKNVEMRDLIKKLRGAVDTSPARMKTSMYLRALQTPKLTFAQISNFGQNLNTLLASDLKSFAKGVAYSFTEPGKRRALQSGATLESVLREAERATGISGEGVIPELATKWLHWTGFSAVERANRTVAANVGFEYARSTFLKLQRNPGNGILQGRLKELGIDPGVALSRNALNEQELLKAAQVMTELTQFRGRPLDLPAFVASPEGKIFAQYKSFAFQQTKFLKNRFKSQIQAGNYKGIARDLMVLGFVFPVGGEVIADIRSLVTGSKRPTEALDRYISNFMTVGGFGILGDTIVSANYGFLAENLLGPSVGTATEAVQRVVQGFSRGNISKGDMKYLLNQTGIGRGISNYAFPNDKKEQATFLQTLNEVFEEY